MSGSYAGRIAPPGMPKMCRVPAASSDLIKLCAPVIVAPACWVITVSCLCRVLPCLLPSWEQKTPRPRTARGDAWTSLGSTRASGAYKEIEPLSAHAATVPVPVPAPSSAVVPAVPDIWYARPTTWARISRAPARW